MEARTATHWLWSLAGALLLLALATGAVRAQSSGPPYDEAEAQAIDRMLMCPVCPGESIDQAQVPLARQMRQVVREKLAQGATRQEILDFFADTYGPDILAAPPKTGLTLLAWVLPVVGVLAALVAGVLALRAMTGRSSALGPEDEGTPSPPEEELASYLAAVDRQLGQAPELPESVASGGRMGENGAVDSAIPAAGRPEPPEQGGPGSDG